MRDGMRRLALIAALLGLAFPATAAADQPPEPGTHGPDPTAIDGAGEGGDAGFRDSGRARASSRGSAQAMSSRLPSSWCGAEQASDDREHELDNGPYRYHAVYAIPADAGSRLRSVADQIQRDALNASTLIEELYGRAIRYDMGTSCGREYLDISVVRLPQTRDELRRLAGSSTGTLDAVARALDAAGFPVIDSGDSYQEAASRTRNWVVWLDGPAPAGACGQGMLYDDRRRSGENFNNLAGKVALVFRDDDERFCGPNSVRHEIGHNLGAVVSGAPHSSGGHCTDAIEDTMCVPGSPSVADGSYHAVYFDYGNDDYWDPHDRSLPWWTVNLSRFLCADARCNVPPGYTPAESASRGEPTARLSVSARARRYGRNRYRVRMSVRGDGRAVVYVRCRRTRDARTRTIWTRTTRAPRTLTRRVRCASRPRVSARPRPQRASTAAAGLWTNTRAARAGGDRWRVAVYVHGSGRAEFAVRCRQRRGGPVEIVWHDTVEAPARPTSRVRCASRPRTSVRPG